MTMSDPHIRILRQVTRQTQRELDHHAVVDRGPAEASRSRRDYLERAAACNRARVVNAEQRRNRRAFGHRHIPDQIPSAHGSVEEPVIGSLVPTTPARKARP
jgi:hypothetical protein